ncbi:MAG: 6-bladed beta-propeller [Bacteroidaceae bacterium]|nr:6-bladed beta-propeller [Bacteroidaceae bacterium]
MRKHILACLALALLASCTNSGTEKETVEKNNPKTEVKKEVKSQTKPKKRLAMPVLDLNVRYPKKIVDLQDIADVEYIVLETHDDGLVSGSFNTTITDSLIITYNMSNDILFFHRDGRFSHSFNRKGGSGKEYSTISQKLCVNPEQKEIYIYESARGRIQIYSFDGQYKRTLKVRGDGYEYGTLFYIDSEFLLLEDLKYVDYYENPQPTNPKPYYRLTVADGSKQQLPLTVEKRIHNGFNWYIKETGKFASFGVSFSPVANIGGELIISDFALDTVYAYRDERLVPIARKVNWMKKNGLPWLVTLDAITDKNYLWHAIKKTRKMTAAWPDKTFLQDRYTGECTQIKLADKNITDKKYRFRHRASANLFCLPNGYIMQYYSAYRLVELYKEGKLQGELKEIASKLGEDDNPVLMLAKFKE